MDEKLPEWLEQCLTEDDRQLIGIVGTEAFLRLIDTYGGGNVYIPKNAALSATPATRQSSPSLTGTIFGSLRKNII